MSEPLTLPIPEEFVYELKELVRETVAEAFADHRLTHESPFLDVNGAVDFLASTPEAIRSLVKRNAIPFHKAPNGRLLFDREELRRWVMSRTS